MEPPGEEGRECGRRPLLYCSAHVALHAVYRLYRLQEKAAAGEPYDPLGAMARDKQYDAAKLPATQAAMDK